MISAAITCLASLVTTNLVPLQSPYVWSKFLSNIIGLSIFSLILFGRAQAFDAGAEAALDVVFETRARVLAVNLDVAGAELERAVDEVNRAPR